MLGGGQPQLPSTPCDMPVRIRNRELHQCESEAAYNRINNAMKEREAALEAQAVIKEVISTALTRVVIREDEELRSLWSGWRRLRHVTGHANFPRIMDRIRLPLWDLSEEVALEIAEANGEFLIVCPPYCPRW